VLSAKGKSGRWRIWSTKKGVRERKVYIGDHNSFLRLYVDCIRVKNVYTHIVDGKIMYRVYTGCNGEKCGCP
jgi:hypothetical protein